MINHHPSDASLLAYANGGMSVALALVVATHLAQCAPCQRTLATLEAVGGVLLDALPAAGPAAGVRVPNFSGFGVADAFVEPALPAGAVDPDGLAPGALQQVLARLDDPLPPFPSVLYPTLPAPLNRVPMGRWWPIARGVRWKPLHVGGVAWGGLVLAQPGRALPRHGHSGLELTCVLSGAFSDGGLSYAVGDLAEPDGDHDDPPAVMGAEPCLCILASEGMHLRGVLGLAQRMIGL